MPFSTSSILIKRIWIIFFLKTCVEVYTLEHTFSEFLSLNIFKSKLEEEINSLLLFEDFLGKPNFSESALFNSEKFSLTNVCST